MRPYLVVVLSATGCGIPAGGSPREPAQPPTDAMTEQVDAVQPSTTVQPSTPVPQSPSPAGSFFCTEFRYQDFEPDVPPIICGATPEGCEQLKYFEYEIFGRDGYFGPCFPHQEAYCTRTRGGTVQREVCATSLLMCLVSELSHKDRRMTIMTPCRKLKFEELHDPGPRDHRDFPDDDIDAGGATPSPASPKER